MSARRSTDGLAVYVGYRIAATLIGLLPEPVMRRLGEGVGWALSLIARDRAALVQRNLARVVGDEAATMGRVRRMFASYGRYWAETFWIKPGRETEILAHSTIDGGEKVEAAMERGDGLIVALPHMGNWEAAGPQATALGAPMLAAAEALSNERIVAWFVATRAALGIEVVIVGKERSSTAHLIRRLKEGGAVALVADRDITGRGVPVEFFDEATTMPAGPVALADRTGATLLPVGCYFHRARGHHFVVGDPIAIPDLPTREERIVAGTQLFAAALEQLIRRAPEQWHIFSPNWPSDRPNAVNERAETP